MDSGRYLAALRRWWWLPLLGVLGAATISYLVARQLPRVYEARATLMVNFPSPRAAPTYSDALLSQQLVKTYAQMVVQPIVLEQVGPRLGVELSVEQLERLVSAQTVRDTQLFTVTAQALQPEMARDIANATADIFIAQQDRRASQNAASSAISVIQPARLPLQSVEPRIGVDVAFASAAALLLMLGLVYVLAWIDDTIQTVPAAERATGSATLGVVPEVRVNTQAWQARTTEAYRLLRTALDFASARRPVGSLLVTSPGSGEGKTTVAAHLASMMALAGTRVIAVDADLRKPALHHQFGMANDRGLANLLQDGWSQGEVTGHFRDGPTPHLRVLTAGPSTPAATELLQSPTFGRLLVELRQHADVVVLDSPPALAVADALVIARQVDAAILVVGAHATRAVAAQRAAAALNRSGTRLLGVVLNRARGDCDAYYATPELAPRLRGVSGGS